MSTASGVYTITSMVAGEGNRVNLHEIPTLELKAEDKETIQSQTQAVAALFNASELVHEIGWFSNSYRIKSPELLKEKMKIPANKGNERVVFSISDRDRLANEVQSAFGTAFLVAQRYMLTAGHCVCKHRSSEVDEEGLKNTLVVFGFEMTSANRCTTVFRESDVYKIKKVVAHCHSGEMHFDKSQRSNQDWALLKLDREVEGRSPLEMNFSPIIRRGLHIYMIGHPFGLPSKLSLNGYVKWAQQENILEVELDGLRGNSGSPVFLKETNQVIGIQSAGPLEQWKLNLDDLDENEVPKLTMIPYTEEEIRSRDISLIVQRVSSLSFVILYFEAKKGNAKAQLELSKYYFKGIYVQPKEAKAVKILNRLTSKFLWIGYFPYWVNSECEEAHRYLGRIKGLDLDGDLHRAALQQNGNTMRFYQFWKEQKPSLHIYEALKKYTFEEIERLVPFPPKIEVLRRRFTLPIPTPDFDLLPHISNTLNLLSQHINEEYSRAAEILRRYIEHLKELNRIDEKKEMERKAKEGSCILL